MKNDHERKLEIALPASTIKRLNLCYGATFVRNMFIDFAINKCLDEREAGERAAGDAAVEHPITRKRRLMSSMNDHETKGAGKDE